MNTLERPPDSLAETISSAVIDFSKDNPGVEFDVWHQDEPIWYVEATRRTNEIAIRRFVQVAFYRESGGVSYGQLAAVPGAQLINEKRGYGLNLGRTPRPVTRLIGPNQEPGFDEVRGMIDEAWDSLGEPVESDFDWSREVKLS